MIQRQLLYLGEINDSQRAGWCKALEVLADGGVSPRQIAIFPHDREPPAALDCEVVQVRLAELELHRPRQSGACWLNVFKTLVCYPLIVDDSKRLDHSAPELRRIPGT